METRLLMEEELEERLFEHSIIVVLYLKDQTLNSTVTYLTSNRYLLKSFTEYTHATCCLHVQRWIGTMSANKMAKAGNTTPSPPWWLIGALK